MPPENTPVPVKMGKFKASQTIVKESWAILKQDKEVMWFPVISSITSLIAVAIMGALFFFFVMHGNTHIFEKGHQMTAEDNYLYYGTLLVYYIVMFFIVNFFLAGLYIVVQGRFEGKDLSFGDGISGARDHIGKIFIWSVISATVGVVLRIISDKSKLVGKIVASLFGAAWNILTYFSLPSLVIGNVSIQDSFKESASIIRKTWGETIIVQFGVGLFFALIYFISIALAVGIFVLAPTVNTFISVGLLLIIVLIALTVISSTLSSIFTLALYNYAKTGTVPSGFSPAVIQGAVKK